MAVARGTLWYLDLAPRGYGYSNFFLNLIKVTLTDIVSQSIFEPVNFKLSCMYSHSSVAKVCVLNIRLKKNPLKSQNECKTK